MTTSLNAVKTCRICTNTKPLSDFHRNCKNTDGHASSCKDCVRAYKHANRDKIATYRSTYYQNHKDAFHARSRADRARLQRRTRKNGHAVGDPWTDEDDAILMADSGLTVEQKALKLGRTYAACVSRRTRLRKNTL